MTKAEIIIAYVKAEIALADGLLSSGNYPGTVQQACNVRITRLRDEAIERMKEALK